MPTREGSAGGKFAVTFAQEARQTRLTVGARVLKATTAAAVHLKGQQSSWSQSLVRLANYLDGRTAELMNRIFIAGLSPGTDNAAVESS